MTLTWKRVLKIAVVLTILALMFEMLNPSIAGAQNPTQAVSHQTTIGPMPTQVESEPVGLDRRQWIAFAGTFAVLAVLLAIGVGVMTSQPASSRGKKKGPKLPRNFN